MTHIQNIGHFSWSGAGKHPESTLHHLNDSQTSQRQGQGPKCVFLRNNSSRAHQQFNQRRNLGCAACAKAQGPNFRETRGLLLIYDLIILSETGGNFF